MELRKAIIAFENYSGTDSKILFINNRFFLSHIAKLQCFFETKNYVLDQLKYIPRAIHLTHAQKAKSFASYSIIKILKQDDLWIALGIIELDLKVREFFFSKLKYNLDLVSNKTCLGNELMILRKIIRIQGEKVIFDFNLLRENENSDCFNETLGVLVNLLKSMQPVGIAVADIECTAKNVLANSVANFLGRDSAWLGFAETETGDTRKNILNEAISYCPQSSKLWHAIEECEIGYKDKEKRLSNALLYCKHDRGLLIKLSSLKKVEDKNEDLKLLLRKENEFFGNHVELWMSLIELEFGEERKKIIDLALTAKKNSAKLWKRAIDNESSDAAKQNRLREAVKYCNFNKEFWFQLINLESSVNRKQTAMQALAHIPDNFEFWKIVISSTESKNDKKNLLIQAKPHCKANDEFWSTLASLELDEKKRQVYLEALDYIPKFEDFYFKAAKTSNVKEAERVLSKGVKICNRSVKLRMALAKIKTNEEKNLIISDAIKDIHDSVILWKYAAQLEVENNYILTQAVTFFHHSTSLWMMLADLQSGEKRRETFLKATRYIPRNPMFWREAAKTQNVAKSIEILKQGIDCCEMNEDLFLDLLLLINNEDKKSFLREALEQKPSSAKLLNAAINNVESIQSKIELLSEYLERAISSESDTFWVNLSISWQNFNVIRIFEEALRKHPESVRLWKIVSHNQNLEKAKLLLNKAVKGCSTNLGLLLGLASIESYEKAKILLKSAAKNFPYNKEIWLDLLNLENANGSNTDDLQQIVETALIFFSDYGVYISQYEWIDAAIEFEKYGNMKCSQAIIKSVIGKCDNDENSGRIWEEFILKSLHANAYNCARIIYSCLLSAFPYEKFLWLHALTYRPSTFSSPEDVSILLQIAEKACPSDDDLCNLLRSKQSWVSHRYTEAKCYFEQILDTNSYRKYVKKIRIFYACKSFDSASNAVTPCSDYENQDIIMKNATNEMLFDQNRRGLVMIDRQIKKDPNNVELRIMRAKIEMNSHDLVKAKETLNEAIHIHQNTPVLYLLLSHLEKNQNFPQKARLVLKRGRELNPMNVQLWIASIRLEVGIGDKTESFSLLSQALEECPESDKIMAEAMSLKPDLDMLDKAFEFMNKSRRSPYVMLEFAKITWILGDHSSCRYLLKETVKADPRFGDGWAYFYNFVNRFRNENEQKSVKSQCISADPNYGDEWEKFKIQPKNVHLRTGDTLEQISKLLPALSLNN